MIPKVYLKRVYNDTTTSPGMDMIIDTKFATDR